MLDGLDSRQLRAQVALVATEDRANVTLEDEVSDASSVLLDHRKKRIKRLARFWMGEGFSKPKPHLKQPPWAWMAQSPLANLLEHVGRAFEVEKRTVCSQAAPLLLYLSNRLRTLQGKLEFQEQRLKEEVALDAESFPPLVPSKKDSNRLEMEDEILHQLRNFSAALGALRQDLAHLLDSWEADEEACRCWQPPPQALEPPPEQVPQPKQFIVTESQRVRAYDSVTWAIQGDKRSLQELVEVLKVEKEQDIPAAAKKLKFLLHPDKAPEDKKTVAKCAFQDMDAAMEAVRKYLNLPRSQSKGEGKGKSKGKVARIQVKVDLDPMLKQCLSSGSLLLLERVIESHAGLLRAANLVRSATSTNLKSSLKNRET